MTPGDHGLELDESQLFEEEDALDMSVHGPGGGAAAAAALEAAAVSHSESDSDDDGIVLESECSSSEEEDDVQGLAERLRSLQSSVEGPEASPLREATGGEPLGTSHSSQVGSLKRFQSGGGAGFASYQAGGKRLFGSSPDLAASVPAHLHGRGYGGATAPMAAAGRRRVAPAERSCNLGTSMPISIPMMQRRPSGADLAAAGSGDAARGGFVPPHVLYRQESERELGGSARGGGVAGVEPSLGGLSPTTAAKREKLLARNAILRSTGFLEVQQPTVIGEVMDPVKEQLLAAQLGGAGAGASAPLHVPAAAGGAGEGSRHRARSSLSQLLGTSK